jgi:hypothetical protein
MTDHRLPDRSVAAFLFDMDGTIVNSSLPPIDLDALGGAAWARRRGDMRAGLSKPM